MHTVMEIKVEGMGCEGCVAAVSKAVAGVAPDAKVAVSLDQGLVRIEATSPARGLIEQAIEKAGYDIAR